MRLNITKVYIVNRSYDEVLSQLNSIVSNPVNDSKYSIFGNRKSIDPPQYIFMGKFWNLAIFFVIEIISTRIHVALQKNADSSKVILTTKTNLTYLLLSFTLVVLFLISLSSVKSWNDLITTFIYLLIAIGSFAFDRFIKNTLIASFERDCNFIKRS